MAIPAKAPLDPFTQHRLVTGYYVFNRGGQQVAIVGQARSKGGTVIKEKGVFRVSLFDAFFKGIEFIPQMEGFLFEGGVVDLGLDGFKHGSRKQEGAKRLV